jgi:hypothetical protein
MKFLCTLVVILFAAALHGQVEPDTIAMKDETPGLKATVDSAALPESGYSMIDRISYRLYLDKQWDSLQTFATAALATGVDYHYLRMRLGVAMFELGKYRAALQHFKKADELNSSSGFARQYMYYCYLNTERPEHAHYYSQYIYNIGDAGARQPALKSLAAETGFKQTVHPGYKNAFFTSFALSHALGRRSTLFHAATYFTQAERRVEGEQFQYYLRLSVPFKNEVLFQPAFHFVNFNGNLVTYTNVPTLITVQPPPMPGNPNPPPPFLTTVYIQQKVLKGYQRPSFIGSLALSKGSRFFNIGGALTVSRLDTTLQLQLEGNVALFPLQNNKIAVGTAVIFHTEPRPRMQSVALTPWLSWYPSKKLYFHAAALINPGNNITENNGLFVSNTADYTRSRLSATLSLRIAPTVWVFTNYTTENKLHLNEIFSYSYDVYSIGFKIVP